MDDTMQPAAPARRGLQPNRAARRRQSHRFRAAVASVNAAKRTGAAEPGTAGAAWLAAQRKAPDQLAGNRQPMSIREAYEAQAAREAP